MIRNRKPNTEKAIENIQQEDTIMKKILISVFSIILLAGICTIWFTRNDAGRDKIELSWDMNGIFVKDDGTEEIIHISLNGSILDTENDSDPLDINITFPNDFRYMFTKPSGDFSSLNQMHNYLPHLIFFSSYVYDKPSNSPVMTYFGLDLEQECMIVLFENAPHCYLVASQNPGAASPQLLTHFEDFIAKLSPLAWKE